MFVFIKYSSDIILTLFWVPASPLPHFPIYLHSAYYNASQVSSPVQKIT